MRVGGKGRNISGKIGDRPHFEKAPKAYEVLAACFRCGITSRAMRS
jgi:hypothetical protein